MPKQTAQNLDNNLINLPGLEQVQFLPKESFNSNATKIKKNLLKNKLSFFD